MKQFFLIWLSLYPGGQICLAQRTPDFVNIEKMKDDSAKVNRWNELAEKTLANNPTLAIDILGKAVELAEKIKYPFGGSVACGIRASMFIYEMKLDSAKLLVDKG